MVSDSISVRSHVVDTLEIASDISKEMPRSSRLAYGAAEGSGRDNTI